jgi:hypothetical protein
VVLDTAAPLHFKNPSGAVDLAKKQTCPTKNGVEVAVTRFTPLLVIVVVPRLIPAVSLIVTVPRLMPVDSLIDNDP